MSSFEEEMELLESTEIVTIIRRPGEEVEVDGGEGLDDDTMIAMLVRALFVVAFDDFGLLPELETDGPEE